MTKTLTHDQFVTAAGWNRAYALGTIAGYYNETGRDAAAAEARIRALKNGHNIAWTVNPGTVIVGDRALGKALLARDAAELAAATIVANGEIVEIEGERFAVRIMGQRYADPIHFELI